MRLVFPVLLILLGIVLVGFVFTNPEASVSVNLLNKSYTDVPLYLVVFVSLACGVAFTATVAVIEGAAIRLVNRRLRRENQRLEAEVSLLRTRPSDASTPGEFETAEPPTTYLEDPGLAQKRPPSAPVYGAFPDEPGTRGE